MQHENCQEETQVSNSLGKSDHQLRKATWEDSQNRRVHSDQKLHISDVESKNANDSSLAESVESGEILSSSSE